VPGPLGAAPNRQPPSGGTTDDQLWHAIDLSRAIGAPLTVKPSDGLDEGEAMRTQGVIVKRCGCLQPGTRRRRGQRCPRLAERGHGSWYFHCSVTTMFGGRERVRRGGYPTHRAAEDARDELLERSRAERTTQTWTVARWLRYWLSTRTSIRPAPCAPTPSTWNGT
jgi:hypothetical protein